MIEVAKTGFMNPLGAVHSNFQRWEELEAISLQV